MRFSLPAAAAAIVLLSLAACSSSFGSGGGSGPNRTYVVMPNGEVAPAQTTSRPPGGS